MLNQEVLVKAGIVLVLTAVCIKTVVGYPDGKVTKSCKDMLPHHGHDPSTSDPPYIITADKSRFSTGDEIRVTLRADSSGSKAYFKGFLIEARDAGNLNEAVGSFQLVDPTISQLLQCNDKDGSAVSHTHKDKKTEVQVVWIAPQDPPSSVRFLVTVLHKYSEYWVKIPGPVVTQYGVDPPPAETTIGGSSDAKTTTASSMLSRSFTSKGCGSSKSCLRDPDGCNPQNLTSCHFLSFRKEETSIMFELSGPAEGYVSFALSLDKWMGNDDVYLCMRDTNRVDVKAAFVSGRTHPEISSENALKDTAWRLSDGVIQCSFRRDIIPSDNQKRFPLDQRYYLFMAHGRAEDGQTHRHDRQPLISSNQKDLTGDPEDMTGSRSPLLLKYHGAFMLIAWMSTVSAGVIIARYFKPDWPEITQRTDDPYSSAHPCWFCFAFYVPRRMEQDENQQNAIKSNYNGYNGYYIGFNGNCGLSGSLLALCWVLLVRYVDSGQVYIPILDVLSCRSLLSNLLWHFSDPRQTPRVITVFLGIHQQALLLPAPWSTGLLGFIVVWFVLADLVLEVHRRGFLPIGKYFKNVKIYTEHINSEDKEEIMFVQDENESFRAESCFKNIILAVYLCGNLGFLTVLLWTIVSV
ncbi:putative ferric-chelate reductase 1 [Triplophysa tibetana]|uniref:Putative ferric-chelate reductase 1 n=1 Tax=Triplophysa tibetana TaxID=1572043 RepID=A0A5A9N641_9TELE|nr:putative ferric-chelate reductase 1 [Triplophysa tibetana]